MPKWRQPGRLLALFLLVVGARFWLIQRYAVSTPLWDQWDAEGMAIFKPWLEGTLHFPSLFAPHNEHRIFLTRVLALGLFSVNGQWDGLLEMAANAVFWGLSAVGIAGAVMSAFKERYQRTILLALSLYFVLPFGWENTLCGFQSQNYFLILFSLLTVWGLVVQRVGSVRWWAGLIGGVLACLSMATGFLAAAAVLGIVGLRLIRERRSPLRGESVTSLLCASIVAVGWLTRAEVPGHADLKAESPSALLVATGRFLAWPLCEHPVLGWLALISPVLLAAAYLRRSRKDSQALWNDETRRVELLLAASFWVFMQTAALAYGRGGHEALPACRYMDLLGLVPAVNFFSWLALLTSARTPRWRGAIIAGTTLWLLPLSIGLKTETTADFSGWLPGYRREMHACESNVRGYVATHDFARFLANKPMHDLPYPEPERLAAFLDDPTLRSVLPAEVRLPLRLQEIVGVSTSAFVADDYDPASGISPVGQSWGSYRKQGKSVQGNFHARSTSPVTLPYLRFFFSGYLGSPALKFSLRDATSGRELSWRPVRVIGRRWRSEVLPNPGQNLLLAVSGQDASRWFAFTAPVELGGWSRWTGFLLRRSEWFLLMGTLLMVGLELLPFLARQIFFARLANDTLPAPEIEKSPGADQMTLLSVVIPARDEEKNIARTVEDMHAELRRADILHEIIVVNDGSTDGTGNVLAVLSERIPELRPVSNPGCHGFGCAIRYGLDHMRGDAVVIVMADASDAPGDVVRYWNTLQEGYDCVFGSRFVRGGRVIEYPVFKLAVNRAANLFIKLLFNVPCNDVTNAFKAYRREVIEGCHPLVAPHFNLTVELPLKAMVRGYRWKVIPITWQNRRGGTTKFKLKEMGSRYLYICGCVWLEKYFSRGDYRREKAPGLNGARTD